MIRHDYDSSAGSSRESKGLPLHLSTCLIASSPLTGGPRLKKKLQTSSVHQNLVINRVRRQDSMGQSRGWWKLALIAEQAEFFYMLYPRSYRCENLKSYRFWNVLICCNCFEMTDGRSSTYFFLTCLPAANMQRRPALFTGIGSDMLMLLHLHSRLLCIHFFIRTGIGRTALYEGNILLGC
jgi:hypothetical protein